MSQNTFLVDNGAYMIKASLAGQIDPHIHFNGIIKDRTGRSKTLVGNEAFKAMHDGTFNSRLMQIVHPQVRGLLQDSDIQSLIWKNVFSSLLSSKTSTIADGKLFQLIT